MSQMVKEKTDQDVQALAEEYMTAERQGDAAFMERTLASDFIGIGPRGFMLPRDEWLHRFQSGDLKYESLEWDEAKVYDYGEAALVTGRVRQEIKYQGQPMKSELRTTLFWVRQQGRWQLAGVQHSPILGRP